MNENRDQKELVYDLCRNCRKLSVCSDETGDSGNNSIEKCTKWVRTTSFSDGESVCSSEISDQSKFSEENDSYRNEEFTSGNREIRLYGDVDDAQHSMLFQNSVNTYQNVTISKSKNVHLGNITYINGPVYVNQTANIVNNQTVINQYINKATDDLKAPRIVKRIQWLAQPPTSEYEERTKPAKYVIISHSATEQATTEADNVLLVRVIQQFHVESRKWDDIAYNFLVGADGNVYEGRGWSAIGSHTYKYNKLSIGICFIGYYVNKLPPQISLTNAKKLIEYGVKVGAIDKDYVLLAHSQCIPTASPGKKLFEELKTWKKWSDEISVVHPDPEALDSPLDDAC